MPRRCLIHFLLQRKTPHPAVDCLAIVQHIGKSLQLPAREVIEGCRAATVQRRGEHGVERGGERFLCASGEFFRDAFTARHSLLPPLRRGCALVSKIKHGFHEIARPSRACRRASPLGARSSTNRPSRPVVRHSRIAPLVASLMTFSIRSSWRAEAAFTTGTTPATYFVPLRSLSDKWGRSSRGVARWVPSGVSPWRGRPKDAGRNTVPWCRRRFRQVSVRRRGNCGAPRGIRTLVPALRGLCPRPLDDGSGRRSNAEKDAVLYGALSFPQAACCY